MAAHTLAPAGQERKGRCCLERHRKHYRGHHFHSRRGSHRPPCLTPGILCALCRGSATFAFGSRLVYPMERGAMRFWNFLANKLFALAWRPLFRKHITDTLCGTKVFLRKDYERTRKEHARIFAADPFGDFALFFIAPHCHCLMKEIPIHYRARQYGATNISRWNGGIQLLWVYFLCLLALLKTRTCSDK